MSGRGDDRRATVATTGVLLAALAGVLAVWLLSAWWSFAEEGRAALHRGFEHPAVLPWTLDGLAFSLALVALAAALDGRPAPLARLGVLIALAGSVWANRLGVQVRGGGHQAEQLATVAPLAAFVAFEVIVSAVRRLVLGWRGMPAPAPIPVLRPVRVLLAPVRSVREWRAAVLAVTAPSLTAGDRAASQSPAPFSGDSAADHAGRVTGFHVDGETPESPSTTPPPRSLPTPAAVDSGRPDALPPGVWPPALTIVPDRPLNAAVDESSESSRPVVDESSPVEPSSPADTGLDGLDDRRGVQPRVHRTPAAHRTGRSTGRRAGRPAGHSPDRPLPDWREVDWAAVAVANGVKRARAYAIIQADSDAVRKAREQLAQAEGGGA